MTRPAKSDVGPFAVLPEWLLESEISDRAIRLFGVLGRYANRDGQCWPARATLAKALRTSPASVDRAVAELRTVGAVVTELRRDTEGDLTSSLYLLRYAQPEGGVITSEDTPPHGCRDGVITGEETVSSPVMTERKPIERKPIERSRTHTPTEVIQTENLPELDAPAALLGVLVGPFDDFWRAYPRKKSKGDALKAWKALRPDQATIAAMLQALVWQRQSVGWQREGGRYVPYPATWLRSRGWEDEPGTADQAHHEDKATRTMAAAERLISRQRQHMTAAEKTIATMRQAIPDAASTAAYLDELAAGARRRA